MAGEASVRNLNAMDSDIRRHATEANTVEEPLPLDVTDRLSRDFGDRKQAMAALLLARRRIGSGDYLGDHLIRCVVHAARGDEARLNELLDPRQDGRDLIVAAEYDGGVRQVRDLSVSFLIDSPEKFWAGQIARLMALRGYRLTSIETRPAAAGPFTYISDYAEGRATFIGPKGEITIEKKDRQWVIHGKRPDLELHRLDLAFADEHAFRDAVSGYLLSNVSSAADDEDERAKAHDVRQPWWRFWK